jgi:predicted transcriptional regulator
MAKSNRDRLLPELFTPIPKRSDLRVLPVRSPNGAVIEGLDVARNAEGISIRIGRALCAMREQAGLSVEEMASDLRASIIAIRRIEEGDLRLSDIAAWEEICNDEVACCPRSLVQDEANAKEAEAPPSASATAIAVRASSALSAGITGSSLMALRAAPEDTLEERIENDRLAARLEQRAKTEARLLTEVADLRAEIKSLNAKGRQYREWLFQLGYDAP